MIYLYGLLENSCAPPDLPPDLMGVTGSVEMTRLPQGALIHGPTEEAEIMPRRRHLLAHTRVLERFLHRRPLLPMRFGMISKSVDAVEHLLAGQADDVAVRFERIRGRVELGLRISFPRPAALAATLAEDPRLAAEHARLGRFGRPPHFEVAEFGRRLAERLEARRTEGQRRLLKRIAPFCTDHVLSRPESDVQLLALEVLLPEGEIDQFARSVDEAAREVSAFADAEPEIRLVGPVPAYNFVRLTLAEPQGEAA